MIIGTGTGTETGTETETGIGSGEYRFPDTLYKRAELWELYHSITRSESKKISL